MKTHEEIAGELLVATGFGRTRSEAVAALVAALREAEARGREAQRAEDAAIADAYAKAGRLDSERHQRKQGSEHWVCFYDGSSSAGQSIARDIRAGAVAPGITWTLHHAAASEGSR